MRWCLYLATRTRFFYCLIIGLYLSYIIPVHPYFPLILFERQRLKSIKEYPECRLTTPRGAQWLTKKGRKKNLKANFQARGELISPAHIEENRWLAHAFKTTFAFTPCLNVVFHSCADSKSRIHLILVCTYTFGNVSIGKMVTLAGLTRSPPAWATADKCLVPTLFPRRCGNS